MMHIAYSLHFQKLYKISPYVCKIYRFPLIFVQITFFGLIYIFCFPLLWPGCIYAWCYTCTECLWPRTFMTQIFWDCSFNLLSVMIILIQLVGKTSVRKQVFRYCLKYFEVFRQYQNIFLYTNCRIWLNKRIRNRHVTCFELVCHIQ